MTERPKNVNIKTIEGYSLEAGKMLGSDLVDRDGYYLDITREGRRERYFIYPDECEKIQSVASSKEGVDRTREVLGEIIKNRKPLRTT